MDEQELKQLKNIYLKTIVSKQERDKSWSSVSHRLPKQESILFQYTLRYSLLFASFLIFLLLGVFTVAQAARPDEPLYPVKVLSDTIVSKVLHKPQIMVERRGKDVIDQSNSSPKQLEKATKEYKKALDEAALDIKGKDAVQKQALKKSLNDQKDRLEKVSVINAWSKDLLQNAVAQTQKTQGEVHGASTTSEQRSNESHKNDANTPKKKE
jgi:hypothetical protein